MSRSSRITTAAGCACLLVIALLVFMTQDPVALNLGARGTDEPVKRITASPGSTSRVEDSKAGRDPQRTPPSKSFDQVESILNDQGADNTATAIRLIDLAARPEVSIEERIEALTHAVLLTPDSEGSRLVSLAQQQMLAPELAGILLSDFHNRPDPTRLAGAVALAKNANLSIQEEAMNLVRFLIDGTDAEGNESEALQKAETKLKK